MNEIEELKKEITDLRETIAHIHARGIAADVVISAIIGSFPDRAAVSKEISEYLDRMKPVASPMSRPQLLAYERLQELDRLFRPDETSSG